MNTVMDGRYLALFDLVANVQTKPMDLYTTRVEETNAVASDSSS